MAQSQATGTVEAFSGWNAQAHSPALLQGRAALQTPALRTLRGRRATTVAISRRQKGTDSEAWPEIRFFRNRFLRVWEPLHTERIGLERLRASGPEACRSASGPGAGLVVKACQWVEAARARSCPGPAGAPGPAGSGLPPRPGGLRLEGSGPGRCIRASSPSLAPPLRRRIIQVTTHNEVRRPEP